MIKPTVYLVGAGPGDRKLITVRGFELIKKADCIIYDYLANPELLKDSKGDCKLVYVGKRAGAHSLTQAKINQLLVRAAKKYQTIVRLKGGDPFIFGRGAEEALFLKSKKINFEVVPGVSSAIAVPAYAGIPLTERSRNSTVGFITGHEDPSKMDSSIDWGALVKGLGTMVFLMGVGNLDFIVKRLIENGLPIHTPVALIRQGTSARQKTVTGVLNNIVKLARKNKIAPPAIIVIGPTVGLRNELNWFENKPLFGKRIIVTRTREQAGLLSEKLAESGAEVLEIPTIRIVSLKADKQLDNAFSTSKLDWVIFTSQNGVNEFTEYLNKTGKDSRIFGEAKICALGSETAKSLCSIGIKPDYVPIQFVGEAVAGYFKNMKFKPGLTHKILILKAKKARKILPDALKKAGFEVKAIDLYDTLINKESVVNLNAAFKEDVDLVTFTSSSTVENFIKLLGKDYRRRLSGVKIASIGPITTGTLKEFGLKADIEAKTYTIEGLVNALNQRGI